MKEYPPEVRQFILAAVASAGEPVTAKTLGALPELGRKVPAAGVKSILAAELSDGSVFAWGDSKQTAYWNRDPVAIGRERVLQLAGEQLLTAGELDKRVTRISPPLSLTAARAARNTLAREKRLRPFGKKTKRMVDVEHPEPYLVEEISALLRLFQRVRPESHIREFLGRPAEIGLPKPSIADTAEAIFSAMNRMAFSPGATVTFYRLHQDPELAAIPKEDFDRAVLLLQAGRRVFLSIHDHAAALPEAERDRFVTDGEGNYYVSIYAR